MKIYLIAPRNPESFWTFDRLLPSLKKKCIFPNLSLPTVAGITPREHEVVLCDENVEAIDFDTDADSIGLTGYVIHKQRIFEILAEFKRRGKFVVIGGPFASLCPEELRGAVDVLFVDEAEYTWPQFLRDYEAGAVAAGVPAGRKAEHARLAPAALRSAEARRYRTMTIQFARGCPFNCEFCDIIVMYGRRAAHQARRAGHGRGARDPSPRRSATSSSSTTTSSATRRKPRTLLRAIAAWQREQRLSDRVHDRGDAEHRAGRRVARPDARRATSPPSSSASSRRGAASLRGDQQDAERARGHADAVHRIQSAGIEVMAGMIVGFDHDDPSIFEEQFHFIQEARIPISMTGMLNAVPKTPLYARLKEAGRLIAESVGDQFVFTNIVPQGMSRLSSTKATSSCCSVSTTIGNYRTRAMALILHKGGVVQSEAVAGYSGRAASSCASCGRASSRASPRRAWFTLSLIVETALRARARSAMP